MLEYQLHNGGIDTILPDIMDVASKHGIQFRQISNRNEYRAYCPFCGDKERKLYLNPEKNAFNCFRGSCPSNGGGGVVKFISLLTGHPETFIMDEIKKQARERKGEQSVKPKKPNHPVYSHPARHLNAFQQKAMGMVGPSWYQLLQHHQKGKMTLDQVKQQLDFAWSEWTSFIEYKREFALLQLYVGIAEGTYATAVQNIKDQGEKLGVDLLTPALKAYSTTNPPKWVKDARSRVGNWLSTKKQTGTG